MLFYFQFHGLKKTLLLQDLGTYLFLVRRSVYPIYQSSIHNKMWIQDHMLLLRVIVVPEILGLFLSPSSFCLHACQEKFVYTKLLLCMKSTWTGITVLSNKIHWEVEKHLGENCFQFNMVSKLKYVRQFCFHASFNLNCHTTNTSLLPSTVCV